MIKDWKFSQPVTADNFKDYLKALAEHLDTDLAQHFQNLLLIGQQDLSLAHCIHHNHVARLAIKTSSCTVSYTHLTLPTNREV